MWQYTQLIHYQPLTTLLYYLLLKNSCSKITIFPMILHKPLVFGNSVITPSITGHLVIKDCCPGPIFEFIGSVRHIRNEHHTLVKQVDLILQN